MTLPHLIPLPLRRFLWALPFVAIGAVRLVYCFHVPLSTTDILRNLGYGKEFWHYGLKIYDLCPEDFSPASYSVLWSAHFYTYPAITLFFFALLAKIWPSIFFGKLVLTVLAALNSLSIYRITNNRWFAWLYWAFPEGIWFGSHEGQFEELAVFWVLMSLLALKKNRPMAYVYLAFAIQTKLFPVFLLPYFIQQTYRSVEKHYAVSLGWFTVGFIPSLLCFMQSQYLTPIFYSGYVPDANAVSWALLEFKLFPLNPFGFMFIHTAVGAAFLGCSFYFMWKSKRMVPYFASMFFVFFVKNNKIAQPWYFILVPSLCLTVEDEKHRRILFYIAIGFGLCSLIRMVYPVRHNNYPEIIYLLYKNMFWIQ